MARHPKEVLAFRENKLAEWKDAHLRSQLELERRAAQALPISHALLLGADRAAQRLGFWTRAAEDAEHALRAVTIHAPKLHPEVTHISPNRSSRNGQRIRLLVVHITVSLNQPGLTDIDNVMAWLSRPSTEASAHIVNDREGFDGRLVADVDKAWACAAYNAVSLNIEQVENDVNRSRSAWLNGSKAQLLNTAAWLAKWSVTYNVPLRHSTRLGVCQHRELGAAGGGHQDCGAGYPLDVVIHKARAMARHYTRR